MSKKLNTKVVSQIKNLRSKGWSLPELKKYFKIGYGTVYRIIEDVKILPEYESVWLEKKKSSVRRMLNAEKKARKKALKTVSGLTEKEKILILSSVYWAEGTKIDLNLTNSDPQMISLFIRGVTQLLSVDLERVRISLRIFENMDKEK